MGLAVRRGARGFCLGPRSFKNTVANALTAGRVSENERRPRLAGFMVTASGEVLPYLETCR